MGDNQDGSLLDQLQDGGAAPASDSAADPMFANTDLNAEAPQDSGASQEIPQELPQEPLADSPSEFSMTPEGGEPQPAFEEPIPGDTGTPAEAVDQMLGEAVVEGEMAAEAPAEEVVPEGLTIFSVLLPALSEPQLSRAKAILQGCGVSMDSPGLVSCLNEATAAQLVVALRQEGIDALPASAASPHAETSEPPVVSDGAPSVQLPQEFSGVLLFTLEAAGNINVVQSLEPVVAHRSITRRFFREAEAEAELHRELKRLAEPSRLPRLIPSGASEKLFRGLFQDLQRQALSLGANAVLGLRLETMVEMAHSNPDSEQIRVVALGTAAIVEILHS